MLKVEPYCIAENHLFSIISQAWKGKCTTSCFNVTMESYGAAEICELMGVYIKTSNWQTGRRFIPSWQTTDIT